VPEEKKYWLDRSENVTRIYRGLWVLGIALVLADLVVDQHDELGFTSWLGFYGLYGFVGIVALILAAKALRRAVMRAEDYYDER